MAKYNFNHKAEETKWLIDKLVPAGHLCFVLAQAGVGKSLWVEAMAISIIYGIPFGDFKTVEGDVLLIDQDTPITTLDKRLLRFGTALGLGEPKHNLILESMAGYSLSDRTLQTVISDHPEAVLTIVDSLHSVCGKLNPNYTTDMSVLAKLKSTCINSHNTIIFNHHISQKEDLSVDVLMNGDTARLAMGSSTIIQQADTYYIIGATVVDGKTERIFVRPVSKRVSIPGKPSIFRLVPTDNGELMEYDGVYEGGMADEEVDVMTLFREANIDRTVKEIYEAMGHRHGETTIREALTVLDKKGMLVMSRHKANLFKYRLPT